jgi:hypothetical protein
MSDDEDVLIADKYDTFGLWGVLALLILLSVFIAGWSIYEILHLAGLAAHWILG